VHEVDILQPLCRVALTPLPFGGFLSPDVADRLSLSMEERLLEAASRDGTRFARFPPPPAVAVEAVDRAWSMAEQLGVRRPCLLLTCDDAAVVARGLSLIDRVVVVLCQPDYKDIPALRRYNVIKV
jgi:hypothetical protein